MGWDRNFDAGPAGAPGTGSNVVRFRRRTPLRQKDGRIAHPLEHFDEQEDRLRMQQNIAAAVVVALLVLSGFWLIDHLRTSARIEACVEAGHRNCVPLDLQQR
jgi:hypothetical protein